MAQENKGKKKLEEMTDHELLVRLVQKQTANARDQKLAAIGCLALAAIFAVALVILVPQVLNTLNEVNGVAAQVNTLASQAQSTLTSVDGLVKNVDGVVADNTDAITEAVQKMNSIDFQSLNDSIVALKTVVEPLADLFGGF